MDPLIQLQKTTPVFLVALACFGLSPMVQALLPPPPPDGGYPGQNTAEGDDALFNLTFGGSNTATGFHALFNNTSGNYNTASGSRALSQNTVGNYNTAFGVDALFSNGSALPPRVGEKNTAIGAYSLRNNVNGIFNTAVGFNSLYSSTNGVRNTAVGAEALFSSGSFDHTAIGAFALHDETTAYEDTAVGSSALSHDTTGSKNTATGAYTLFSNTVGLDNTATGRQALVNNLTGNRNTADGDGALAGNTAGSNNIAVGFTAGNNISGNNNIDIGNAGVTGEDRIIRIGNPGTHNGTFIAGIRAVTVPSGVGVIVGSNHQLGTVQSSKRFKEAIKPMDKASEAILALNPVTFRYKQELDPDRIPQFGVIAEDVEKVSPDLVVRDENGDVSSVRYEAVNAMLLNEFLKAHRKIEEQGTMIAQQQKQIEALTTGLQRVSAQLELNKPAPQTVLNNQ